MESLLTKVCTPPAHPQYQSADDHSGTQMSNTSISDTLSPFTPPTQTSPDNSGSTNPGSSRNSPFVDARVANLAQRVELEEVDESGVNGDDDEFADMKSSFGFKKLSSNPHNPRHIGKSAIFLMVKNAMQFKSLRSTGGWVPEQPQWFQSRRQYYWSASPVSIVAHSPPTLPILIDLNSGKNQTPRPLPAMRSNFLPRTWPIPSFSSTFDTATSSTRSSTSPLSSGTLPIGDTSATTAGRRCCLWCMLWRQGGAMTRGYYWMEKRID